MKKFYILALAMTAFGASAETYSFSSMANVDTTGVTKEADGIYLVSKGFTVAVGDVLTIDNKSTVKLGPDVMIYVEGEVNFAPADTATIVAADKDNPCKGFQFTGDSKASTLIKNITFDVPGIRYVREAPLTVEHCAFLNTTSNVNSGAASISFVHNNGGNKVTDCRFIDTYGSAIAGGANILTGIEIENCYLKNCVTSNTNRPYLNLTVGGDNPVVVKNNTIIGAKLNMPGAITVANLLSLNGDNKVTVEGNYAENCRYGINIMGRMNAVVKNNKLVDNHYELNANNGGSGITAYNTSIYIEGNHIEGSLWGITLVGSTLANIGKIDKEANDYNPGNNVFLNNGNCGTAPEGGNSAYDPTKPYDLYNNTTNEVYAQNNHWSVAQQTEELIETVIFHKNDNPSLGQVIFMPANDSDGVETISGDKDIVATKWYSLTGAQLQEAPEKGISICVETYSDGTSKSVKVIR